MNKPSDEEIAFLYPAEYWTSYGVKAPKEAQSIHSIPQRCYPHVELPIPDDIDNIFLNNLKRKVEKNPESIREVLNLMENIGAHVQLTTEDLRLINRMNLKRLEGATLSGLDLSRFDFYRAQLEGADLSSANTQEADFRYADLRSANMMNSKNRRADFSEADLTGANLTFADNRGTNFHGTYLVDAVMCDTKNEGADFSYAYLDGTDLVGSENNGAIFDKAMGTPLRNDRIIEKESLFVQLARRAGRAVRRFRQR